MKIEPGKTYIDRDGCKVRIIAVGVKHAKYTIAGIRTKPDGSEEIISYHASGAFTRDASGYDLQREATIYDDFNPGDLALLSSPGETAEILCLVSHINLNGVLVLQHFGSTGSPRFAYDPENGLSLKRFMTAKEWKTVLESRS